MNDVTLVLPSEFYHNSLTEAHIYAPNLRDSLAIGFYDVNQKGILVLSDAYINESSRLISLLLAEAPDANFLLIGMPLVDSPNSRLEKEIKELMKPYPLLLETQTIYEGQTIHAKDLVLTPTEARIILRNKQGNMYDAEAVITVPYNF